MSRASRCLERSVPITHAGSVSLPQAAPQGDNRPPTRKWYVRARALHEPSVCNPPCIGNRSTPARREPKSGRRVAAYVGGCLQDGLRRIRIDRRRRLSTVQRRRGWRRSQRDALPQLPGASQRLESFALTRWGTISHPQMGGALKRSVVNQATTSIAWALMAQ
jgi:hypothetical protein